VGEKNERNVEHEALRALHGDFKTSRENIERVLQSLANGRLNFARFQSATPAELTEIDPDAIRPIISALLKNNTFDPVTATLDALANDGRLGLIRDSQVLKQLSSWKRDLDNIADISFELRTESVRMRRAMESHGGPFMRWRSDPDNLSILLMAEGEDLADLRRDADFMGNARSHQYALSVYYYELRELAETLDSTVALLDQITSQQ
jgi:uncharacterized protein YjhX (UPF0386 family)